jgi:hypothetical protein
MAKLLQILEKLGSPRWALEDRLFIFMGKMLKHLQDLKKFRPKSKEVVGRPKKNDALQAAMRR